MHRLCRPELRHWTAAQPGCQKCSRHDAAQHSQRVALVRGPTVRPVDLHMHKADLAVRGGGRPHLQAGGKRQGIGWEQRVGGEL